MNARLRILALAHLLYAVFAQVHTYHKLISRFLRKNILGFSKFRVFAEKKADRLFFVTFLQIKQKKSCVIFAFFNANDGSRTKLISLHF